MKLETAPDEATAPPEGRDSASSKGKSSSNSLTLSLVNKVNELSNNQQPSKKKGAHIKNDHHPNNNTKSDEERSPSDGKNSQNSNEIKLDKTNGEAYKSHFENGTYICPLCDEVMTTSHDFTVHIRQHNPNDHSHTCRLCGKTLSSASSLDRHMLVHSGERPFKCKLCTMAFTTNGNMHRHMRTHGEDAEQFKRDAAAAAAATNGTNGRTKHSHKRKAETPASGANNQKSKRMESDNDAAVVAGAETETRCPICDKSLGTRLGLEEHMTLHANDPIYCKECNGTFSIYSAYRDHNCKGGLVNGSGDRKVGIGFQDLSFIDFSSNKFSLIAKSVCESNSRRPSSAFHAFECEKCDKSFPCASALRLHAVTHTDSRGTYCATCECDFLTPRGLQTHQLKHRMTEQCGEMNFIARESDFGDDKSGSSPMVQPPEARKEDFLAVLQLKNNDSRKIPKIKIKKDRTKENNFENVSYFVHGKPEPPKYVGGGKEGIAEPSDFADIQSIISVTSKSPFAGGGIRSSPVVATPASPLQVNSSTCVSPESPIAADSANASPETPSKEDSEHSSIKGSEDADTDGAIVEGIYSCKLCNLHYNNVKELKRHNREHPQSCSSYSCSLCPYNSTDKSTLVRHLRTHNGERPFQCVICKFAFTTKANCERHVRKRHKKQSKLEIRSSMQYNPNMGDTLSEALPPEISGSETVCKYCTVDFKSNRVLRHHLRSLHNSCRRKPFFCTLCKLGFSTKNNCIRHVAKQHPTMKDKIRDIVISNVSQSDCSDQEDMGAMSDDGGSPHKWDSSQTADSNHNWDFGSLNETQSPQKRSFDLSSKAAPADLPPSDNVPTKETVEPPVAISQPLPLQQPLSLIRARPATTEDQPLNLTVTALCLSSKHGAKEKESSVTEDVVSAANGLVSLSEVTPPQDEPLDLAVHALDLTVKSPQTKAIALTVNKDPKPGNFFTMRRMPPHQYYPRPPTSRALRMPFSPPMPALTAQAPLSLLVRNRNPIVVPSVPPPPPPPPANREMIPIPVNHVSANHESSYRTFRIVNDRLSPRNQRSFSCVYCASGFTLKSNMERHIKRKHPEFARPTRSRNFIPMALSSTISKNTVQTLSNKTRDALRVVLNSKAGGASSSNKDEDKMASSALRGEDVEEPRKTREENFHSELSNAELSMMSVSSAGRGGESTAEDRETEDGELVIECPEPEAVSQTDGDQKETTPDLPTDLASVSSVIDTANSQQFPQFLTSGEGEAGKGEEMDDGDYDEDEEDAEDEEDYDEEMKDHKESAENMPLESSDNQSSPSNSSAKKRSSYMDSPNSVACPFCSRKFPWTSSLRRHILTHTGQKPFKCPRCPIWFTTKSNCERHLMRKHGQNSDILTRTVPDRPYKCNVCPSSTFSTSGNLRKHYYLKHFHKTGSASRGTVIGAKNKSKPSEPERYEDVVEGDHLSDSLEEGALPGSPDKSSDHGDCPYKCHLCEASFDVRKDCLSHLEEEHAEEYKQLVQNSPPDSAVVEESESTERNNNDEKTEDVAENGHLDEEGRQLRCAFCAKRFWSADDLRRHVRTHSGARPYACDVCNRSFALKHILIRHRRKHSGKSSSAMVQDSTDDDCSAPPKVDLNVPSRSPKKQKQKRKPKSQNSLLYLMSRDENAENEPKSNPASGGVKHETGAIKKEEETDLIQNLLGIRDSKMIDQMLDSADSAARLLGVKEV